MEREGGSVFTLLCGEIARELCPCEIAVGVNGNVVKSQLPFGIGVIQDRIKSLNPLESPASGRDW